MVEENDNLRKALKIDSEIIAMSEERALRWKDRALALEDKQQWSAWVMFFAGVATAFISVAVGARLK